MSRELERRIEKAEMAVTGCGSIPKEDQMQTIVGRIVNGVFVPNIPGDSVEKRKEELRRKYGNPDGVLFVKLVKFAKLIDSFA
ncbi:MAG: hypothetical protein NTV58_14550 [Deltaproteobacteria bacterium]|nr:hypothetical protein [Deltaproteobacteria bacterium]